MGITEALKSSGEKIESVYVSLAEILKYHISYAVCYDNEEDTIYWRFFFNELKKHICFTVTISNDFVNAYAKQEIINRIIQTIIDNKERRNIND